MAFNFILNVDSRLLVIALVVSVFIGAGMTTQAGADLGIVLSNTCIIMLKNNFTSTCPGYDELLLVYPDNSNKEFSGSFAEIGGLYQRDKPQAKNHFEIYRFDDDKNKLWIDPPIDIYDRIQLITITSYDFIYSIGDQKITNSSIKIGQGRHIDNSCRNSIITSDNWIFLLGDTIQHLLLKCEPGTTNFNEIKIREWERTMHDITTSIDWQLKERIKYIKENCLFQYAVCGDGHTFKIKLSESLSVGERIK